MRNPHHFLIDMHAENTLLARSSSVAVDDGKPRKKHKKDDSSPPDSSGFTPPGLLPPDQSIYVFHWGVGSTVGDVLAVAEVQSDYVAPRVPVVTPEDGLKMLLLKSDAPFKKGSDTLPRDELRFKYDVEDDHTYRWDVTMKLASYSKGTEFSFMQVFGSKGPNVMVRFRNGSYELLCKSVGGHNLSLPKGGLPLDDVGSWHTWTLLFNLRKRNGFVVVYKDNLELGSLTGDTSGGGSYLKLGPYYQGAVGENVELDFKDMFFGTEYVLVYCLCPFRFIYC